MIAVTLSTAQASVSTNRNYKGVVDFISQIAKNNPQNASLFTLGYSNSGVEIKGIKLGNGPINNLVVATHHGNEYGSTEVALKFAESLAINPIPDQTLFVIPVLNIDGYNRRSRHETVNGKSVDPNRDYPGPCGSQGPFNLKSTKALSDLIQKEMIVTSATIHTYWPAAVYPWGLSSYDLDTPYTPIFMNLAKEATSTSTYQIGNAANIIYPADGTFEDYAFWKHGVWSILFEAGHTHSPNLADLNQLVNENVPGLRKMFEVAPQKRAAQHDFTGVCQLGLKALDLGIE
jgi:carboxypeptidase T